MEFEPGSPIVAALSQPNESRWGFHQFPALSSLPDGRILLMYADAEDASETHGHPAPAFVSSDEGQTWQPHEGDPAVIRPHYSVSPLPNGEYLVMPSTKYMSVDIESLPDPLTESEVYGKVYHYRAADLSEELQHYFGNIHAQRWNPETRAWKLDTVAYDMEGLLAWRRGNSVLLPRTYLEHPLLAHKGELFYADYRGRFEQKGGLVTPKGSTTCMVSADNGKSLKRRSTIAMDPEGNDLYGEPFLAETHDGRLMCVIRKADQDQKPMAVCFSADSGYTWSDPEELFDYGVFPGLLKLDNGTMVLSYGRPGVWLTCSEDGTGTTWSEPVPLIKGAPDALAKHTCGYTSLLALGPDRFLIAYSDFQHIKDNTQYKSILVRQVTVKV